MRFKTPRIIFESHSMQRTEKWSSQLPALYHYLYKERSRSSIYWNFVKERTTLYFFEFWSEEETRFSSTSSFMAGCHCCIVVACMVASWIFIHRWSQRNHKGPKTWPLVGAAIEQLLNKLWAHARLDRCVPIQIDESAPFCNEGCLLSVFLSHPHLVVTRESNPSMKVKIPRIYESWVMERGP